MGTASGDRGAGRMAFWQNVHVVAARVIHVERGVIYLEVCACFTMNTAAQFMQQLADLKFPQKYQAVVAILKMG